ncbi:hypothetical protein ACWEN6_32515 [Sphaerisporangium sp. NPDC004334]
MEPFNMTRWVVAAATPSLRSGELAWAAVAVPTVAVHIIAAPMMLETTRHLGVFVKKDMGGQDLSSEDKGPGLRIRSRGFGAGRGKRSLMHKRVDKGMVHRCASAFLTWVFRAVALTATMSQGCESPGRLLQVDCCAASDGEIRA